MKNQTKTFVAIALGAAIASPAAIAGGVTADHIAEERANLHADGSLPFIHSPKLYGDSVVARDVIWSAEQLAEFHNLHSDGSLL